MTEPVANLAELLSFGADATVAIVDRATDPPTSITYGELRRDVMALAGALVAQGLRCGDRVGILADNTAD